MPHATPDADTSLASSAGQNEIYRHLTESVLTLQQTICNIRQDVADGIAPSILMPVESAPNIEDGLVFLSLEPSSSTVEPQIGPLDERLHCLETGLKDRAQWQPPAVPPKSPEYSIIDISDLKGAIRLLEDIYQHSQGSKAISPQPVLSKYKWKWDPAFKEYYAETSSQTAYIYLSRWHLNEQRQVWEHVSMDGTNLEPESAAELLGSWDDWTFDPLYKEWHLDVSDGDEKTCIFASRWQAQGSGEWVYVGRIDA